MGGRGSCRAADPIISAFALRRFCFTSYMRLQKFLAQAGVASRRASEAIISDGRVTVNGEVITELGSRVDPHKDVITLDGKVIELPREYRTIALYKPRGVICSASSEQGKTVLDLLGNAKERLFPIGRLDKDSEGLILLTNDGELANILTHPRHQQIKRYEVTVSGDVNDRTLTTLNDRLEIDGYKIRAAKVTVAQRRRESGKTVLIFELREGRNRQIRKMCDAVGLRIHRLVRTQIKHLALGNLTPGKWRNLTAAEVEQLKT